MFNMIMDVNLSYLQARLLLCGITDVSRNVSQTTLQTRILLKNGCRAINNFVLEL